MLLVGPVHQARLPDDAQPRAPGGWSWASCLAGGPTTSGGKTIRPGCRTPDELTDLLGQHPSGWELHRNNGIPRKRFPVLRPRCGKTHLLVPKNERKPPVSNWGWKRNVPHVWTSSSQRAKGEGPNNVKELLQRNWSHGASKSPGSALLPSNLKNTRAVPEG